MNYHFQGSTLSTRSANATITTASANATITTASANAKITPASANATITTASANATITTIPSYLDGDVLIPVVNTVMQGYDDVRILYEKSQCLKFDLLPIQGAKSIMATHGIVRYSVFYQLFTLYSACAILSNHII